MNLGRDSVEGGYTAQTRTRRVVSDRKGLRVNRADNAALNDGVVMTLSSRMRHN